MHVIKGILIAGTLVYLAGCAVVAVGPPMETGGKVPVCHKGKKTIYVDEAAVDAHLGHGDYVGTCR